MIAKVTEVIEEIKQRIERILGSCYINHNSDLPCIKENMLKNNHQMSYREASRLLFVLYLLDYLRGSYDSKGIYDWFNRRRSQLDGLSPAELLDGNWNPNGPIAQEILELARSLAQ